MPTPINFNGIIIGAAVFLRIGICHPLVIDMEFCWGKQSWRIWLVAGESQTARVRCGRAQRNGG